jgi:uncharacterized membrane protein YbhN (UPF0104 family)
METNPMTTAETENDIGAAMSWPSQLTKSGAGGKARGRIIIGAKVLISAAVIFAIGRRFEIGRLMSSLHHANIPYLVLSVVLAILAVPVVGKRWGLLAEMFLIQIPTALASRATFAGLFVGQVLPGAIGADVVRGWMVWNMGLRNNMVIASIVADRIASLFAVGVMILMSMPVLMRYLPQSIKTWIMWASIAGVLGVLIMYALFKSARLVVAKKTGGALARRLLPREINVTVGIVLVSLGLAVIGHMLIILSAYFLSLAIGVNSSLWMWWLVMPIIILVTAVPVSINGWGVREFAMVHLWALFGVAQADAFLISICMGIVAIASSLPGLWFWFEKRGRNAALV